MNLFDYRAVGSVDEALSLLAEYGDEAKLIAGGTALVIMMKQNLVQPSCLVDVRNISDLSGIRTSGEALSIGSLTTHREVETSPLVARHFPALAYTYSKVATIRIRDVATVGGNLAHGDPSLDPPVTLTALDARVRLVSGEGERVVPLDELYLDYYETDVRQGELLAELQVPFMPPRSQAAFIKFLPRTEDDYGTVTVGVRLTLDESGQRCADARVVLGAAASTTLRVRDAEAVLRGQAIGDAAFREAGAVAREQADPVSDIRGSSDYKKDMVEVFVRRALRQALDGFQAAGSNGRDGAPTA